MTSASSNPQIRNMSHQELKSRSSEVTFALKFAIYVIAMSYGAGLALSSSLVAKTIGIIMLGLMFAHGVELQHQVLHNQGFRNRVLNELVGILLGLPLLVSFAGYQASHLRHHKHLGTPENKEFFDYGDQYGASRLSSMWNWFCRFAMPSLYTGFLKNLVRALLMRKIPDEAPDVSVRMCRDYIVMLAAIVTLAAVSWLNHSTLIFSVWLLPMIFVGVPVHALIEMPEHFRCDTTSTDPFRNTRTIQSNALMNWFTNGNNYHVEHHMMPGLPIDRLHDLHAAIRKDIKHFHPSYRDFYLAVLRGRLTRNINEAN